MTATRSDGVPSRRRAGFRTGVLVGLLVAAAAFAAAWRMPFSGPSGASAAEQAAALRAQLEQSQAQTQSLQGQLAATEAELAVEQAARRALENSLGALQTQAGELRDRLAFYDQLLPAGPAGTVTLRAVQLVRVPSGLRYRVLLMRAVRPGQPPFVGALRFTVTGEREGEPVQLTLTPLQAADAAAAAHGGAPAPSDKEAEGAPIAATALPDGLIPLEMDQYRTSEGILALPPDFTPSEATVDVVQNGVVLTSQQVPVTF
ncbi:DUF6776 family protein [Bordetella genomosp. 9]|uniref:Uncharacterized protein n=1 Tax=Bordetella genomosp. 9 TaxID=1416803 RepID=A0A1W6Z3G8_9BORD|nr:DUF6776 family protein [Bordetella genomosp. 9]ARP87927.1 hypothetical protein CAL13_18200 [Bordetella genomosp. 9]